MPRPKFPPIVLPVSSITRIREAQTYYDKNPERAEREQEAAEADRIEATRLEAELEQQWIDENRYD